MRQATKFTEAQTVAILTEADAGRSVNEIWRSYSISSATYYSGRSGMAGGGSVGLGGTGIVHAARVQGCSEIAAPHDHV